MALDGAVGVVQVVDVEVQRGRVREGAGGGGEGGARVDRGQGVDVGDVGAAEEVAKDEGTERGVRAADDGSEVERRRRRRRR